MQGTTPIGWANTLNDELRPAGSVYSPGSLDRSQISERLSPKRERDADIGAPRLRVPYARHPVRDARRLLELEREAVAPPVLQLLYLLLHQALSARGEVPALHHRLICSELEALATDGVAQSLSYQPIADSASASIAAWRLYQDSSA